MVEQKWLMESVGDFFKVLRRCDRCGEQVLHCQWCGTIIGKKFFKIICLGWNTETHPRKYKFPHVHFCSEDCAKKFMGAQTMLDAISK